MAGRDREVDHGPLRVEARQTHRDNVIAFEGDCREGLDGSLIFWLQQHPEMSVVATITVKRILDDGFDLHVIVRRKSWLQRLLGL